MFLAIGIVAALALGWALLSFNRFVNQKQLIENSWSNVDTELHRRHDLIPNMVRTVKGYATHEQSTLTEVIEARRAAAEPHASPTEQAGAESLLVQGLRHLMVVSEAYPDLVASSHFIDLQRELVTTEDRIQAARRLYNGNVRDYNRRIEQIPSMFIAKLARFAPAEYFEVEPAIRVAGAPPVGGKPSIARRQS